MRLTLAATMFVAMPAIAAAQPRAIATVRPPANERGWHNSTATILYYCAADTRCPEPTVVATEGRGQVFSKIAADAAGAEAALTTTINFDRTPPSVSIDSPRRGQVTTAASVLVVARATDALAGVVGVTCNGRPASIDPTGRLECTVPLRPGANDIVVEASDAADNSGSAGIHVTRVGPPAALRVMPDRATVLIGQPRVLQVVDDFWRPVTDIVWRVDNPAVLEMSTEGNIVIAKAPGITRVTAMQGGMSVDAQITVSAESSFPVNAVVWHTGSIELLQTPHVPGAAKHSEDKELVLVDTAPGRASVMAFGEVSGHIPWVDTPAVADSERIIGNMRHVLGGSVLVVESADRTTALVRGGPSTKGALPWRYRSSGRLSNQLTQDSTGAVVITETGSDRIPRILIIEGRSGVVRARVLVAGGVDVALNIGCVAGANAVREIPADSGPATVQADGSLALEIAVADDFEDFSVCGSPIGYSRRVVQVASVGRQDPKVEVLGRYEVPTGSPAPIVTLFPIASDGTGGQLAPFRVRYGPDGPVESHLMHLTGNGVQEHSVPIVGQIVVPGNGLAAMTDGMTVVAFRLDTGQVMWTRVFTKGVHKILPTPEGDLVVSSAAGSEVLDEFGRTVPLPRPR